MTTLEIYENVSLKAPLEQRRFFDFFNNTVDELEALYHTRYVFIDPEQGNTPIHYLDEDSNVKPLYHEAIIDNILFLSGQDETYKSEFVRKSKEAYLKYWEDVSKNRIRKRECW